MRGLASPRAHAQRLTWPSLTARRHEEVPTVRPLPGPGNQHQREGTVSQGHFGPLVMAADSDPHRPLGSGRTRRERSGQHRPSPAAGPRTGRSTDSWAPRRGAAASVGRGDRRVACHRHLWNGKGEGKPRPRHCTVILCAAAARWPAAAAHTCCGRSGRYGAATRGEELFGLGKRAT